MKSSVCRECDNYKFAIKELRLKRIFALLKFTVVLAFVAVLSVAFDSYIPCLFLFLLLL